MKYLLFVLWFCKIFGFNTFAQTTGSDSLKYFRDAFVKIKTLDGIVIYIDPYTTIDRADSADIVLITHEHYDHNELWRVRQKTSCQVIRSADALKGGIYQSFTIGNIKVTAVPAYNGYHPKNQCVGYVVEFNGIKLYHAGDTGKIPEMADLTAQNITYSLLPMDGVYTMTPEEATQAAAIINAKYDIPIHTSPVTDPYDVSIASRFTSPNKMMLLPDSMVALERSLTSVENIYDLPQMFSLEQNYPNPFNPTTNFEFRIPPGRDRSSNFGFVSLKVYDILGNEVATLVNEEKEPGSYEIKFDASKLSSGIYFYELNSGSFRQSKKMLLLK